MARPTKNGGAFRTNKTLADGSVQTYWYAYRGGPRIEAPPGSRAFKDAVKAAQREQGKPVEPKPQAARTLQRLIDGYLDSPEFSSRAPRTQSDYAKLAKLLGKEFGALPILALETEGKARAAFVRWRNHLAKSSLRQADYAWTFLNIVLNWAKALGDIKVNPCREGGVKKLYTDTRKDKIWSDEQIRAFASKASPELLLAMTLAVATAQRQGDLLGLTWRAYDGRELKIAQGKSRGKIKVTIPVTDWLRTMLDATPRKSPIMLVNQDGIPWTPDGFRVMWRKTCVRAGVKGVTFHDLRGTVVTRLAIAGASEAEIATLTGHTLAQVRSILDANYLHRDPRLARSAVARLEGDNGFANCLQPIDLIEGEKVGLLNKA
jgi:integrase